MSSFAELHRAVAGAESGELKLIGSNVNIGSGTTALRIMLPIGALVYLFCRAVNVKSPDLPATEAPVDLPEAEPAAPAEPDPAAETEDVPTQEPEQ